MTVNTSSSDFVMHGARSALLSGLTHIEEQIKGIERAVTENPGLAFDLAKTVVESTCKTILSERSIGFETDDDLPKLFKKVTMTLPLLPAAASNETEARKTLAQTLNGLHTALQGVCELRNACGFASHGSAGPRPTMASVQALLAAQAADAIVGFVHRVHRQERQALQPQQPNRSQTVDKVIDGQYEPVDIAGQPYAVSEALFHTDPDAYLALAAAVTESQNIRDDLANKYPTAIQPDIESLSFVHFEETVLLKVKRRGEEMSLEDASFIINGVGDQFFSPNNSPDQNAKLFVTEFDSFSIINCFDFFTEEAKVRISEAQEKLNTGMIHD
ncbi:MAG: hypothetical protein LZF62_340149 [Nitrospira sp.]|nr:MAG: hypothetical protein LZF62_340149 [Nitrospira sp.]